MPYFGGGIHGPQQATSRQLIVAARSERAAFREKGAQMGLFTAKKKRMDEMPFPSQITLFTLASVRSALKHQLSNDTIANVVGAGLAVVSASSAKEALLSVFKNESLLSVLPETHLRRIAENLQNIERAVQENGAVANVGWNYRA
jgi:hypothetical protein